MRQLPRITVITPSFNQAAFIERTILSVLNQDYPNLEYFIMDGGSTDGTIDIMRRYKDRIQWISERDDGQADAINKGIGRSTGDIISYLNSDDMYTAGTLHRVGAYFSDHPESMWLTGRCKIVNERDVEIRRPVTAYKNFLLRRYSYSLLLVTNPISQPATFWRRQAVEEFGVFDKDQHFVMDYEYWLRIAKRYRPAIVDEELAAFRVYTSSKTSSSFLRSFREELDAAKRHTDSPVLLGLHWLSYVCIASAYFVLNGPGRLFKSK